MHGQPTAILMAAQSTRRRVSEPQRERRSRRAARTAARVLQVGWLRSQ
jgi:hypothetical protein